MLESTIAVENEDFNPNSLLPTQAEHVEHLAEGVDWESYGRWSNIWDRSKLGYDDPAGRTVATQTVVRYRRWDDGQVEVVGYNINVHKAGHWYADGPIDPETGFPVARPKAKRGESEDRDKSIEISTQRSKRSVREKSKSIHADHLITLNYRENVQDRERVLRDLKEFVRKVNRVEKMGLRKLHYVAVLEKQERGAYHIHMAVHGFKSHKIVRAIWYEIVGKGNGQIDIQGPGDMVMKDGNITKSDRRKARRRGAHQIAAYLSKYITKDAKDIELNKKRYFASRGIVVPERQTLGVYTEDFDCAFDAAFLYLVETANLQGMQSYRCPGRSAFWFATSDARYQSPLDV
ncbi:rolling circle replication-associated protein [Ralstonia pseudosolanacearum]|uniref:rolling circle replication-associated protein n=1 Tax=Ralstonia pseudosolanacearum TaxID=1310165 RepID=UPI003C2FC612